MTGDDTTPLSPGYKRTKRKSLLSFAGLGKAKPPSSSSSSSPIAGSPESTGKRRGSQPTSSKTRRKSVTDLLPKIGLTKRGQKLVGEGDAGPQNKRSHLNLNNLSPRTTLRKLNATMMRQRNSSNSTTTPTKKKRPFVGYPKSLEDSNQQSNNDTLPTAEMTASSFALMSPFSPNSSHQSSSKKQVIHLSNIPYLEDSPAAPSKKTASNIEQHSLVEEMNKSEVSLDLDRIFKKKGQPKPVASLLEDNSSHEEELKPPASSRLQQSINTLESLSISQVFQTTSPTSIETATSSSDQNNNKSHNSKHLNKSTETRTSLGLSQVFGADRYHSSRKSNDTAPSATEEQSIGLVDVFGASRYQESNPTLSSSTSREQEASMGMSELFGGGAAAADRTSHASSKREDTPEASMQLEQVFSSKREVQQAGMSEEDDDSSVEVEDMERLHESTNAVIPATPKQSNKKRIQERNHRSLDTLSSHEIEEPSTPLSRSVDDMPWMDRGETLSPVVERTPRKVSSSSRRPKIPNDESPRRRKSSTRERHSRSRSKKDVFSSPKGDRAKERPRSSSRRSNAQRSSSRVIEEEKNRRNQQEGSQRDNRRNLGQKEASSRRNRSQDFPESGHRSHGSSGAFNSSFEDSSYREASYNEGAHPSSSRDISKSPNVHRSSSRGRSRRGNRSSVKSRSSSIDAGHARPRPSSQRKLRSRSYDSSEQQVTPRSSSRRHQRRKSHKKTEDNHSRTTGKRSSKSPGARSSRSRRSKTPSSRHGSRKLDLNAALVDPLILNGSTGLSQSGDLSRSLEGDQSGDVSSMKARKTSRSDGSNHKASAASLIQATYRMYRAKKSYRHRLLLSLFDHIPTGVDSVRPSLVQKKERTISARPALFKRSSFKQPSIAKHFERVKQGIKDRITSGFSVSSKASFDEDAISSSDGDAQEKGYTRVSDEDVRGEKRSTEIIVEDHVNQEDNTAKKRAPARRQRVSHKSPKRKHEGSQRGERRSSGKASSSRPTQQMAKTLFLFQTRALAAAKIQACVRGFLVYWKYQRRAQLMEEYRAYAEEGIIRQELVASKRELLQFKIAAIETNTQERLAIMKASHEERISGLLETFRHRFHSLSNMPKPRRSRSADHEKAQKTIALLKEEHVNLQTQVSESQLLIAALREENEKLEEIHHEISKRHSELEASVESAEKIYDALSKEQAHLVTVEIPSVRRQIDESSSQCFVESTEKALYMDTMKTILQECNRSKEDRQNYPLLETIRLGIHECENRMGMESLLARSSNTNLFFMDDSASGVASHVTMVDDVHDDGEEFDANGTSSDEVRGEGASYEDGSVVITSSSGESFAHE